MIWGNYRHLQRIKTLLIFVLVLMGVFHGKLSNVSWMFFLMEVIYLIKRLILSQGKILKVVVRVMMFLN